MKNFTPPAPKSCQPKHHLSLSKVGWCKVNFREWVPVLALAGLALGCDGGSSLDEGDAAVAQDISDIGGADAAIDSQADTTGQMGKVCVLDKDCPAPANSCRVAVCEAGSCGSMAVTTAQTCDDGDLCTTGDQCAAGKCVGKALTCNDDEMCTADYCDPAKGCQHAPLEKPCNTDDLCAIHQCQAGKCVLIDASPCDDENPCTSDSCDAVNGCQYKALSAAACDDEDGCTTQDTCKFGVCVGKGTSCSDGNACTDDTCDSKGKCLYNNNTKPCSDGDKCTAQDACSNGSCKGSTKACDDGNPCTINSCNVATGQCNVVPAAAATPCDDGDKCTVGEKCVGYVCSGGGLQECTDGNPCTIDSCNTFTGCAFLPNDGAPCGQGDLCISAPGKCQAGKCDGVPKSCDDNNPCTSDLCDPPTGLCTQANVADGTACGEGVTCQAGVCL